MNVLVTGAPGWLGTRFVKALCGEIDDLKELSLINQIDEIRCLVLDNIPTDSLDRIHSKVKIHRGDLTNINSLDGFFENCKGGTLFHLAGIVHPLKRTQEFYKVNLEGSKNILNLAIKNRLKRIIAVSSNSPAGTNSTNDDLFTEDRPYNPYMNYGISKMKMETEINKSYKNGNLETVIIRPCWFYGPDQPPRQTLFFSMIKNGSVPIVGSGENKRSMSYIDNTCSALLLAYSSEKANGQTYWIADKKPYSMNEIVDTIEKLLEEEFKFKVAHKRLRLPNIIGETAYWFDLILQSSGIYHQKIHVLSEMNKTIACSVVKAQKDLGYSPKISLEEGMRRSLKWCIDSGMII